MRRKYSRDLTGADIAVTGIPFDQAVTSRPGTRFGPQGVRAASAQFAWGPYWPWNFDPFDTLAVVDYGDCFFDWGRKQDVPGAIQRQFASFNIDRSLQPIHTSYRYRSMCRPG
ncbi:MAG: arginase family protein [Actinobacteria bacterium]|nr:arginase family protein [Actinomycetota bacterium]